MTVKADDIVWSVYTTGKRDISNLKLNVPQLQVVYDRYQNNFDTFRLCLKSAGNRPLIMLEDDIEVCANFQMRVMEEVILRPNDFIAFYSGLRDYQNSFYMDKPDVYILCFYFPPYEAARFLRYSYLWKNRLMDGTGTDNALGEYLVYCKYKCWQVVPNLVTHAHGKSLINPTRSTKRRSAFFIEGERD